MDISIAQLATIITFLGSVIVVGISIGKLSAKVDTLAENVNKHNNIIERTYKLESNIGKHDIGVMAEQIKENQKEIAELKKQKGCSNQCLQNLLPK